MTTPRPTDQPSEGDTPFKLPDRPPPVRQTMPQPEFADGRPAPYGPAQIEQREIITPNRWWKALPRGEAREAAIEAALAPVDSLVPPSPTIRNLARDLLRSRTTRLRTRADIWLLLHHPRVDLGVLARELASCLFRDASAALVVDCAVPANGDDRLFGTPPGYAGFLDGGIVINQLRRRPASVIIFSNIEYAESGTLYNMRSAVRSQPWTLATEQGGRLCDILPEDALLIMSTTREWASPAAADATDHGVSALRARARSCIVGLRPELAPDLDEVFGTPPACTWGI